MVKTGSTAASPLDKHFEADLELRVEAVRVVALHYDRLLAPRHELLVVLDVRHHLEQLVWRVPVAISPTACSEA